MTQYHSSPHRHHWMNFESARYHCAPRSSSETRKSSTWISGTNPYFSLSIKVDRHSSSEGRLEASNLDPDTPETCPVMLSQMLSGKSSLPLRTPTDYSLISTDIFITYYSHLTPRWKRGVPFPVYSLVSMMLGGYEVWKYSLSVA